jgi:hypothetical protein
VRRTRHRLDPAALFEDVVGEPDAWQRKALRSDSKRQLYLASRQSGKSSVAAIKALHTAMCKPSPQTILLVSPSLSQSQEIFRKALLAYRLLGRPEGVASESALRLELGNGSRIISLPGSERTSVAYTSNLLVIDEASRTPAELLEAVLPTTAAVDGMTIVLSSPKGARGWFYDLWRAAQASGAGVDELWERYKITADECPRISQEQLDAERMMRGEPHVRQEYYCSFESDESGFFEDHAVLERSLVELDDEPLWFPERNA